MALLARVRDGLITEQDWNTLNSRNPVFLDKPQEYGDYVRLFGSNEEVNHYNIVEKLASLDSNVAKIVGTHSDAVAAFVSPNKAWGLEPVLYLAVGAKVMLRLNLFAKEGLVNGAVGTVRDIIFENGKAPDAMPKCIIVEFPDYTGKELIPGHPKCIPITSFTATWTNGKKVRQRTQFPLKLGQ